MTDPALEFPVDDDELAALLLERRPRREFLFTPKQVADLVGVDRQTVYRWIKSGRLTAARPTGAGPGRAIRIPATEVRAMLAAQRAS